MEEQSNLQERNQILEIVIPIETDADADDHSADIKEEHLDNTFNSLEDNDHVLLEIEKLEPKSAKKRVSLTIEKKIEIIQRHEKGEAQKKLALEFNVGRTTISDILKRKYKFFKFMAMNADKTENLKRRRTLRRTVHKVLEDKLLEWYNENRHMYISGPMIAQKAQQLHKELGYNDNFSASNGWLDRFKARNGIKLCGLREIKTESDENAVAPFKTELESLAQWYNLSLEQIYNADETDLFWKMLPNPESDLNEVKSSIRAYRERMTVLCCSNATGTHKLPLACIGRGKKTRTFTSQEIKNLSVLYYSQETAWMTNDIFKDWFHMNFIPSVREHLRSQGLTETALLLIDRNSSHPSDQHLRSEDSFFFVQYFPPKVKALIQPMEQGLMRDLKLHYRYNLLKELLNKNITITEFHKQLNIKDAIKLVSDAWNAISIENIQQCFSKIFPVTESNFNSTQEEVPMVEVFMDLIKRIPECTMYNEYSRNRLEYWLTCDEAEPKKDCNAFYPLSYEYKECIKTDEEENDKVFENYNDDMSQAAIEVIESSEMPQGENTLLVQDIEIDDEIVNTEDILTQSQQEVIINQIHLDHDASEDNILYEETECDVSCKQALDALNTVLKFMKNDNESRYRDVVFLSELKKKLRKRLVESNV